MKSERGAYAMTRFLPFLLIVTSPAYTQQAGTASLESPDGRLAMELRTVARGQGSRASIGEQLAPEGGQLVYLVRFQGKSLIEPSVLGLDLKDQPPLGQNVRIVKASVSSGEDMYRLISGKTSSVDEVYRALRLELEEPAAPGRKLIVEARAYNDAVAFRYVVPEQAALHDFRLAAEGTQFRISKDPFVWALVLPNYRSMYESEFIKLSASSFSNQGGVSSSVLLGLPLLMEVPGVAWMAITEANLRDYAAMYLTNPGGSWASHEFQARLAPHLDDAGTAVTGALPHPSAWRVLLVGTEPGRLVESNAITSLNPEPAFSDTSWIKPGKASWDWWSGSINREGASAFTTDTMKYYVDFAAESGFEYMLVDAGWSVRGDITKMNGRVDIPEVVRYAAGKNVKVWIWLSYQDTARQMEEAFPLYEKWGVAGLKIDFVERDDQGGIDWYYRVADLAARHHLMLDFHGATKPTGMERTYPNVLGYEAVAGMEQSKAGSRDNPDHQLTLPFTRMLAGPMDYTPGGFDNVTKDDFEARSLKPMVMGTRAHQLAMYAIYLAPFQMVSDYPRAYRDQPSFAFIQAAPASWDESKVLNGRPGEFITMARRHGNEWFLGSMTNWNPRDLDIPLSFLGPGRYRAEIYADAEDADRLPKNVSIVKQTVDRAGHLKAHLAPGGGYAVRFVPER
ncbi:MAG TPA: glycoside hydrolase family 97 protein [Bryobacteraceae bacterium]|nr:glycoside hydrolase family 97 protein [Bryobacteraceae bacterium]